MTNPDSESKPATGVLAHYSARSRSRWPRWLTGAAVLTGVVTAATVAMTSTAHSHAPSAAILAALNARAEKSGGAACTTQVLHTNHSAWPDEWEVGMSCYGNSSDKVVYIRGVLDVPGALDAHTAWVSIGPHSNLITPPRQTTSRPVASPWERPRPGSNTTNVHQYQSEGAAPIIPTTRRLWHSGPYCRACFDAEVHDLDVAVIDAFVAARGQYGSPPGWSAIYATRAGWVASEKLAMRRATLTSSAPSPRTTDGSAARSVQGQPAQSLRRHHKKHRHLIRDPATYLGD